MTKIVFLGVQLSGNLGGPSLLSTTIKVLRKFISEAEFTLLSPAQANDFKLGKTYEIQIVPYTKRSFLVCLLGAFFKKIGLDSSPLSNNKILSEYMSADLVIDISGIIFADSRGGGLISRATKGIPFIIGKLLNKPVIKYTADIGPFKKRWTRFFAKFYLNKTDLILARGEITKKCLIELGITSPIHVCPDTAFLLDAVPNQKINEVIYQEKLKKKHVIGISVSYVADQKEHNKNQYSITMAQTADYLIKNLNAFVVLIPNDIFPNTQDDVYVAQKIYERIDEKEEAMLIIEEYPANELKGIIGECDILIGARYHSIVAAISMCIPTIAIAWHHKYHQVMDLVGQDKYVCNIETLKFSELRSMVDSLWKNRKKVRAEIASQIPSIKESIFSGGKMIREVLDTIQR